MMKEAGVDYSLAGENLAKSDNVEEAFINLINSPEHKDNILKERFDNTGIGVIESPSGKLIIVQLFIDTTNPAE